MNTAINKNTLIVMVMGIFLASGCIVFNPQWGDCSFTKQGCGAPDPIGVLQTLLSPDKQEMVFVYKRGEYEDPQNTEGNQTYFFPNNNFASKKINGLTLYFRGWTAPQQILYEVNELRWVTDEDFGGEKYFFSQNLNTGNVTSDHEYKGGLSDNYSQDFTEKFAYDKDFWGFGTTTIKFFTEKIDGSQRTLFLDINDLPKNQPKPEDGE